MIPSARKLLHSLCFLAITTLALSAAAQAPTAEQRTARAFDAAKNLGPGSLYAFLKPMPKGADLHMHLGGSVYAETFLAEAVESHLCIDLATPAIVRPPCTAPLITAADALKDQKLYDRLIDAFSMRDFVPFAGWSGHDQFFVTFDRFGAFDKSHVGDWLDEVASRASDQNEQYLEIMQTPTFSHAAALGNRIGWPAGADHEIRADQLAALRTQLLSAGLRDEVPVDSKEFADAKSRRAAIENCDIYDRYKKDTDTDPSHGKMSAWEEVKTGCSITIHWLYQILRGFPPQQVFAQTVLGFEVASADPEVVGINFVMPEDGCVSMRDYHLQMQMLDYLHSVYPKVHISLHAGELAPGMVPPEGLTFHIREAIDLGHAERIGHGIDVLYELHHPDTPVRSEQQPLLKEMAAKHIDVEVNLTSNDGILGIKGAAHPLHAYMAAHVPFSLSTDDEGVSRIDLTHEYVKASEDQDLTYADLKQSARASLEHAFLHGESLYATPDDFTHRKPICAAPVGATTKPTAACQAFLNANEKASLQYDLERRFAVFESTQH